jgi:adenosylcobinamide kinase/adenosylcobinamide-phosphate guanylyltransferase
VKTLILGGARSGKSMIAERLASRGVAPVTYVATVRIGDDADLAARVEEHRLRRSPAWTTIECGDNLATLLGSTTDTVLVDSLGPWLADLTEWRDHIGTLCDAIGARDGDTIIVSDEVGLSVHPETRIGREFRDALGTLNQRVAAVCDDVLFVVAGRAISLAKDRDE